MTTHTLKTAPEPFQAILDGTKRFEFRRNDRGFVVGDYLYLMEYEFEHYTGRGVTARVLYLLRGPAFGIPEGFACMSVQVTGASWR